jgi:hypothetical protein
MSTLITIATAFAALNVLLLGVLTVIWLRNYRTFKTPLILGLLAFVSLMLLENAVSIYFFFSMGMLYSGSPIAQQYVVVLRGLEFLAIAFLTYVTLQ